MSIKQTTPPDVQGNSKDGLPDGSLPMGSSVQGMTSTTHEGLSLGDIHTGYCQLDDDGKTMKEQREGDELTSPPMQKGGFVGRPGGWER